MNDRHPADDLLIARALDDLEDLGERERAELEAHIAECPRCGEMVTSLASAMRGFRERERPEAPAGILVDLIALQAAALEGRRPAAAGESGRAADRERSTAAGLLFRRMSLNLAPALAVAALLVVLFLTGFWAGRRSVPGPVSPPPSAAPAGSVGAPGASTAGTRVALIPHPLPEPPRIPFQPVQSEIR